MSLQKKQTYVEDLRRQLAEAEQELAAAKRLRVVEPAPGSKVHITAQFPGSSKVYEYLAIRVPEGGEKSWYVTGRAGAQSWDQIMSRIEHAKNIDIQRITFINYI